MLYDIERLLEKTKDRYQLVNMLAKRARELNMGAATDIDKDLNKVIPIVLQEMIEGRIRYEELKE